MSSEMIADPRDMGTSGLAGRSALDIGVVRALSKRSDLSGLLRYAVHLGVMGLTGTLVYFAMPHWILLIPAMVLHGFTIVTMFAPMHECVHRTAFDSRILNEIFGWLSGLFSFYNFTYYRYYHTWHHRFTQDPEKDPELMDPKPRNVFEYILEISGILFWLPRPWLFLKLALGRTKAYPFIPEKGRKTVALSAGLQLAVYVAGIVSIALGYDQVLYYWFLPAILAQPFLRAITLAEHTGCSQDENGLTNTRTTLTLFPVRLLMWNMPFHTEHHLYPSIPFFRLPQAHRELKQKLVHLAPSYVSANREIVRQLK
ncbi:fatty acid desaturase [Planctomicrobium sp. SH661]|uniref:fatty acid desaturase n=1 Tax=Planctomicrobium sp. SH661 TaxID=3448124 RepID=UPI003F5B7F70